MHNSVNVYSHIAKDHILLPCSLQPEVLVDTLLDYSDGECIHIHAESSVKTYFRSWSACTDIPAILLDLACSYQGT